MRFNLKNYQNMKTKDILKKNDFLFFTLGANQNSQNWIILEQNLHKLSLTYNKTYNNIAIKILHNSSFRHFKSSINSTFFFLFPKKNYKTNIKNDIVKMLSFTQFKMLSVKLNKKIYAVRQFQNINSYNYKKNISIMYQFLITTLKSSSSLESKR